MEKIKLEINNIDDLYSKYDGYIKNINIIVDVKIGNENRFIYNDFIKAANYFINNNPNEFSFISINSPFNIDNDSIYWNMIQDEINVSYKITIELILYIYETYKYETYKYGTYKYGTYKYGKFYKINKYDNDDNYLIHYL